MPNIIETILRAVITENAKLEIKWTNPKISVSKGLIKYTADKTEIDFVIPKRPS